MNIWLYSRHGEVVHYRGRAPMSAEGEPMVYLTTGEWSLAVDDPQKPPVTYVVPEAMLPAEMGRELRDTQLGGRVPLQLLTVGWPLQSSLADAGREWILQLMFDEALLGVQLQREILLAEVNQAIAKALDDDFDLVAPIVEVFEPQPRTLPDLYADMWSATIGAHLQRSFDWMCLNLGKALRQGRPSLSSWAEAVGPALVLAVRAAPQSLRQLADDGLDDALSLDGGWDRSLDVLLAGGSHPTARGTGASSAGEAATLRWVHAVAELGWGTARHAPQQRAAAGAELIVRLLSAEGVSTPLGRLTADDAAAGHLQLRRWAAADTRQLLDEAQTRVQAWMVEYRQDRPRAPLGEAPAPRVGRPHGRSAPRPEGPVAGP